MNKKEEIEYLKKRCDEFEGRFINIQIELYGLKNPFKFNYLEDVKFPINQTDIKKEGDQVIGKILKRKIEYTTYQGYIHSISNYYTILYNNTEYYRSETEIIKL